MRLVESSSGQFCSSSPWNSFAARQGGGGGRQRWWRWSCLRVLVLALLRAILVTQFVQGHSSPTWPYLGWRSASTHTHTHTHTQTYTYTHTTHTHTYTHTQAHTHTHTHTSTHTHTHTHTPRLSTTEQILLNEANSIKQKKGLHVCKLAFPSLLLSDSNMNLLS